jgi:cytochrome P450
VFRRLSEEAPLYYNPQYDFYAVSRYEDVERVLADRDTFISGRGGILEMIKANVPIPPGVFIFEDPPLHTIHRGLLTRVFTPKKMAALEPMIRELCARALDPLVERGEFDFIADLGGQMPMRVIGMLLGIPEEDQQAVRARADAALRTERGKPQDYGEHHNFTGEGFEDYIDWRAKHPSDDLMTELLNAEFVDETGSTRRLTREEVLIFVNILASAGNETTSRLIGWTGKTLAEHPDQRRMIYEDRSLVPQAIEEVLRFEPPAPHIGRYVARDVELHGRTVPEGSVIIVLPAAANRDPRKFADGDRFDILRERAPHLTFGHGFHVCLGNALARVEGRVALDELLNRFPEWDVDLENANLSSTSTVRGWETLPAFTPSAGGRRGAASRA